MNNPTSPSTSPAGVVHAALTAADRADIYELRYKVLVEELGYFAETANHDRCSLTDQDDESSHQLALYADGNVIGAIRLTFGRDAPFSKEMRRCFDLERFAGVAAEAQMVVFSRLVVAAAYRRGEATRVLLGHASRLAYERGGELAFCACSPHLLRFYEAMGFRAYCHPYDEPAAVVQFPLVLVADDVEHLRSVGSPVLDWRPTRPWPTAISRDTASVICHPPILTGTSLATQSGLEIPPLLRSQSSADEAALLAASQLFELRAGMRLVRHGQTGGRVYVVLGGTLLSGATAFRPGEIVNSGAVRVDPAADGDVVAGSSGATVLSVPRSFVGRMRQSRSADWSNREIRGM